MLTNLVKPLKIAFKGKGPTTLLKRLGSISQRYGLTAAKMDRSLNSLAELLDQYNAKASLPITAVSLARNPDIIRKYQDRGIEFAVHGYVHVDYSQLSLTEHLSHFKQAQAIFQNNGLYFQGFRCPYLRANEHTVSGLAQSGFVYDSSPSLFWPIIDPEQNTESYERALGFYGALPVTEHPSLPEIDFERALLRIPYSLPDDESLIERINWRSPAEMDQAWVQIFEQTYRQGELFNLGLHPERVALCLKPLQEALEAAQAKNPGVWYARLDEIASWWQARYDSQLELEVLSEGVFKLTLDGPPEAKILVRQLDTEEVLSSCQEATYQMLEAQTGLIRLTQGQKRPLVGISPQTPLTLTRFLQQQGYICETSETAEAYTIYLDYPQFNPKQKREILALLQNPELPLLKLSLWPQGKRSAFCITGDIDCLTIWDYILRFMGK